MDYYWTSDLNYLTSIFFTVNHLEELIKQTTKDVYVYRGILSTCTWTCTRLTDNRYRLLVTFKREMQ